MTILRTLATLALLSSITAACAAQTDGPAEPEALGRSAEALKRAGTMAPPAGCMGTYQGSCRCAGDVWYDSGSYYCTTDQAKCGDYFKCWCSCPTTE